MLANENMRGVCFDIRDAIIHAEDIQSNDKIVEATCRAINASFLTAKPRLAEPLYLWEVHCEEKELDAVYCKLKEQGAFQFEEHPVSGTPTIVIKALLPVSESIGLTSTLR